jgi:preprotein translocase subunit SecF
MIKFDVIGRSKLWFAISGALAVAAIVAIAVYGLNFGIDFVGGSLLEVQANETATVESVKASVAQSGFEAVVQESGDQQFLLRLPTLTRADHDKIIADLNVASGPITELHFESIGPVIGEALKQKTMTAVLITLVLILLYVAWSFRAVSKPVSSWKYATLVMATAVHDVIIPLGAFAVLGHYYGYQVDTAFIAAMLTIMGYSINDTIVVFDRTRENLTQARHRDESFGDVVNKSVNQTFARSINSSMTPLLAMLAVLIFGGESIRPFATALVFGIVAGTYSSIFIASPLLVAWNRK